MKRKKNGFSFLTVVIVLVITSFLLVSGLTIATASYRLNETNEISNTVVHSSESLLNKIKLGITSDCTNLLEDSYLKVLSTASDKDSSVLNTEFKEVYKSELQSLYTNENISSKLQGYLSESELLNAVIDNDGIDDSSLDEFRIKGVSVNYTDNKYNGVVKSDIVIKLPDIFSLKETRDTIGNYSEWVFVTDNDIIFENYNKVNGNVYSGRNMEFGKNSIASNDCTNGGYLRDWGYPSCSVYIRGDLVLYNGTSLDMNLDYICCNNFIVSDEGISSNLNKCMYNIDGWSNLYIREDLNFNQTSIRGFWLSSDKDIIVKGNINISNNSIMSLYYNNNLIVNGIRKSLWDFPVDSYDDVEKESSNAIPVNTLDLVNHKVTSKRYIQLSNLDNYLTGGINLGINSIIDFNMYENYGISINRYKDRIDYLKNIDVTKIPDEDDEIEDKLEKRYVSICSTLEDGITNRLNSSCFNYVVANNSIKFASDFKVNDTLLKCDNVCVYNSYDNTYNGGKVYLVVAKGDVTVNNNFDGVIITTGKIKFEGSNLNFNGCFFAKDGIDLTNSSNCLYQALLYDETSSKWYSPLEFIGEDVKSYFSHHDETGDYLNIQDTIVYDSWRVE